MGGRKVCFIDHNGQVGTCIRGDENCVHCPSYTDHYKWVRGNKETVSKVPSEGYHMAISNQVHILEQTAYGLRDLASAFQRMGMEKVSEELYWRAGHLEEVMEKTDRLIVDMLKHEKKNLEVENAQLKEINDNIDCKMCSMPHMKTIRKILNEE